MSRRARNLQYGGWKYAAVWHIARHAQLFDEIYAKAYTVCDKLWLFYEREALEGEDLEAIIQRMILRLQKGLLASRTILERMDSAEEDSSDND